MKFESPTTDAQRAALVGPMLALSALLVLVMSLIQSFWDLRHDFGFGTVAQFATSDTVAGIALIAAALMLTTLTGERSQATVLVLRTVNTVSLVLFVVAIYGVGYFAINAGPSGVTGHLDLFLALEAQAVVSVVLMGGAFALSHSAFATANEIAGDQIL